VVDFPGWVASEQVPELLAESHCGICPVTGPLGNMLLPNKIYEYVASGLPALIPRTPLLAAHYPESAVVFYRPDDVEDFAAKLIAVYEGGQPLRARLCDEGGRVLHAMSWANQRRTLLECVDRLVREPRHRRTMRCVP
jgi:Glycosyl transferases group 1